MQNKSVIVTGKRTPIGAFQGALSSIPAAELAAATIKSILNGVYISLLYLLKERLNQCVIPVPILNYALAEM